MPAPPADSAASGTASSTTLVAGIALLGLEAIGLAVIVILLVYADFTAPSVGVTSAVAITTFTALLVVLLVGLAWGLRRRRAWARGPAIVLELLMLPIGYSMVSGGLAWLGVPVMLLGLCGAGALLAPATRAALGLH
jgi:MYXO-CTERM domain-containing protein